jgi:hypothetical protein
VVPLKDTLCGGVARCVSGCHDGAEGKAAAAATVWPDMGTELPAPAHLAAGSSANCRQGDKEVGSYLNLFPKCMPWAAGVSCMTDMAWLPGRLLPALASHSSW